MHVIELIIGFTHPFPPILSQGLGLALIGVGAWLEVEEGILVDAVNQQAFLVGPYLLIAVGVAIVMVAVVGMIGAMCDRVINRVLLYIVSCVE